MRRVGHGFCCEMCFNIPPPRVLRVEINANWEELSEHIDDLVASTVETEDVAAVQELKLQDKSNDIRALKGKYLKQISAQKDAIDKNENVSVCVP